MAKPRSEDELRKASAWFRYEVWMLYETARLAPLLKRQADIDPTEQNKVIANALAESMLVHARTLLGFFEARNPRQHDVTVEDFFTSKVWEKRTIADAEKLWNSISQRLAHLTYVEQTVQGADREWDAKRIVDAFDEPVERFWREVDPNLLSEGAKKRPVKPTFGGSSS